ncbi:hypothetical protein C8F04DRAFT_1121485 [Mycena alexandri]|uniref:Uncharacterized protein n=1 Tax=Mycena alexandri TaxID=1745969 RepID=A0AAD6SHP2_9AGAR|nr:hypothetical protein C8F04DRAFT_1121485 [Mycena alexandri]
MFSPTRNNMPPYPAHASLTVVPSQDAVPFIPPQSVELRASHARHRRRAHSVVAAANTNAGPPLHTTAHNAVPAVERVRSVGEESNHSQRRHRSAALAHEARDPEDYFGRFMLMDETDHVSKGLTILRYANPTDPKSALERTADGLDRYIDRNSRVFDHEDGHRTHRRARKAQRGITRDKDDSPTPYTDLLEFATRTFSHPDRILQMNSEFAISIIQDRETALRLDGCRPRNMSVVAEGSRRRYWVPVKP